MAGIIYGMSANIFDMHKCRIAYYATGESVLSVHKIQCDVHSFVQGLTLAVENGEKGQMRAPPGRYLRKIYRNAFQLRDCPPFMRTEAEKE